MMNAVGGTSLHYWAQSRRLNPCDCKVGSETARRYGAARIPKGRTAQDWPFDHEELEPYYDKVECEAGLSGKAGNINGKIDPHGNINGKIDPHGNIFETLRKREHSMPPLRGTKFTEHMGTVAEKHGWTPLPGAAAINSVAYDKRAPCRYHGYCNGGGCPVNAKDSSAVSTIPRALESKRLTVVTRAHVRKVDVNKTTGRQTGVTCLKDRTEYFQPAKAVRLAGSTYENVRLLLLSQSKAFAKGLASDNGQVGRHYMTHNTAPRLTALFPENINTWHGMPAQGVAVDNWADDNFDHSQLDFIGGGNMRVYSDRRPVGAASMTTCGQAPRCGLPRKAFIKQNAERWNPAYQQKSMLPCADNVLGLDPTAKDRAGHPVIRSTATFKDNDRYIGAFMQDKLTQWFMTARAMAVERGPEDTMGSSTHAYGGTRMGNNKETYTGDRRDFAHEVPNLGVLGASAMGISGAHNPTLTAQALAWRTAQQLAQHRR